MIAASPRASTRIARWRSAGLTAARAAAALLLGLLLVDVLRAGWVPVPLRLLVVALLAVSAWRPADALLVTAALVPFGAVLGSMPLRASEAFVVAWLCGTLLPIPRHDEPREGTTCADPLWPAIAFGVIVLASLAVRLSVRDVGLAPWPLAVSALTSVGTNYLVSAGRDLTLSSAMLPLEGILLLIGVVLAGRRDLRLPGRLLMVLAAVGVIAALVMYGDTVIRFVRTGDPRLLSRYIEGERFSIVSADVNAAGSLLAMTGTLLVALAGWRRPASRPWLVAALVVWPALGMTGSRTAALALAASTIAVVSWRAGTRAGTVLRLPRRVVVMATIVLVAAMTYGAWAVLQVDAPGSAGRALGFRSQFLVTSVRMLRTAPWFGVGVGQYYGLSGHFMPEPLRAIYGMENAHAYFMQVTTELGAMGLAVFAWLVAWPVVQGWRRLSERPQDTVLLASTAAVVAYLLTCLTGHPLLVPETAMPFWMMIGLAIVAGGPASASRLPRIAGLPVPTLAALVVIVAVVVSFPVRATVTMDTLTSAPAESGFLDPGVAPDGRAFRWMSDVAVMHIPSGPGLLELPLRAPDAPGRGPFVVDIFVRGWRTERVTVPAGEWRTVAIVFRDRAPFHFRKITLHANQTWTPGPEYGLHDPRPVSVMAGTRTFLARK